MIKSRILQTAWIALIMAGAAPVQAKQDSEQQESGLYFEGDSVELQTQVAGRHVSVQGYVGDQGPFNMIVDTGAGGNVIDLSLVEGMGLEVIGQKEVMSGGVVPMMLDVVIVPSVRIGDLTIRNAEFLAMDILTMTLGNQHAVIGMPIFKNDLLAFDTKNEKIRVSRAELSAGGPNVFSYVQEQRSGFEINVNVAGTEVPMVIDTGNHGGFIFPMALSETLPLKGDLRDAPSVRLADGERKTKVATLDGTIQLGSFKFADPEVRFLDPAPPHGNIGLQIVENLVLSIDQKNGLLSLAASEGTPVRRVSAAPVRRMSAAPSSAPAGGKKRSLGVGFRGSRDENGWAVGSVGSGSLGEQSGIMIGDILLKINGQAIHEIDMKQLGPLFGGSDPLHMEISRDGETRMIEIP